MRELLNQYTEFSPEITDEVRVFKGTRVSVWFVLTLIQEAWSQEDLVKHYPSIQPDAIAAVFDWCEAQQDLKDALDAVWEAN